MEGTASMRKWFTVLIAILLILIVFTQKELLLDWIQNGSLISVFISIIFVSILVFFPVVPYPVLAGSIGSVFGVWVGMTISLIGIMFGTMIMFYLSRYGFQQPAQKYLEKYPKVKEYEAYFAKNAFLGILFVRLVPVVPSPVVNILSGLSHIKWYAFFIATFLGKIPAVVTFTFAGSVFEDNKWLSFMIYGTYFLIISTLVLAHLRKERRQSLS
jgi:uncharacterized membrane protein YdjX (TVP38/TMEM64 family)